MNIDNDGMARIIAKAWADDGFKARLQSAPAETLRAEGIAVPDGIEVVVVEDSPSVRHFVLPAKPAESDLSEQALESIAGGLSGCNYCSRYC